MFLPNFSFAASPMGRARWCPAVRWALNLLCRVVCAGGFGYRALPREESGCTPLASSRAGWETRREFLPRRDRQVSVLFLSNVAPLLVPPAWQTSATAARQIARPSFIGLGEKTPHTWYKWKRCYPSASNREHSFASLFHASM